ncbi:restriction endonuclease [Nocardia sp. NPDC004068]|uniref:restriction endonuclease n=1 Tax=Nocardia sp. NPDC004068 TaxID=3364303 RepID=UPI00368EB030
MIRLTFESLRSKGNPGLADYNYRQLIEHLQVPEPVPDPNDYLPRTPPGLFGKKKAMDDARKGYEIAVAQHRHREQGRLAQLAATRREYSLFQQQEQKAAAERVQAEIEQQAALWPKHAALDPDVRAIWGIIPQVEAHNQRIASKVGALSEILMHGLRNGAAINDHTAVAEYQAGIPDGIEAYFGRVLSSIALPVVAKQHRVAFSTDSSQLVVEYQLPTVGALVPAAKSFRYVKTSNTIAETARPASQIKALYANAIAQITLLCLARIFAYDSQGHVQSVVFNGVVDTLDPRTGKPVSPCLVTVRVDVETFSALDLENVEPSACLKHLSAAVSKSPTELAPVRPVLEFSMVDPRFVEEADVMSGLDSRPNLLELTPTEFESLIQNLFTKMGLEARQTRPSRDGGVDCVAYDTRPILGGKVVIQAKRYKNTVGVSAVRDLYGTLQNEGASKGILVTTSGYGAASFEFANNKPIELIDGANLLYLLEEHADIKARIQAPDGWRDPVID